MKCIGSNGCRAKRRQGGATLLGVLIIVAILGVGLYAGIRLFPLYKEYFDIVKALQQTSSTLGSGASPADIRKSLDRRWEIEGISTIRPKDVEINRVGDETIIRAQYRAEAEFVGNVSLVVDFDKSVKMGGSAVP